jgi:subtilase family serine protease
MVQHFAPHLAAHAHSVKVRSLAGAAHPNLRLSSNDSFYYPNDLIEAYTFPSFRTSVGPAQIAGVGSTIGVVISSTISPSDLANTFNSNLNLGGGQFLTQAYTANSNLPVPTVTIDPVDGGSGAFNASTGDAAEASLDTQMSLGTAPGAKEIVYDMPDLSDASIIDAYTQVDEENRVDVVSSSFGECELDFSAAANGGTDYTVILQIFHALFAQGNAQGITFVAWAITARLPAPQRPSTTTRPTAPTSYSGWRTRPPIRTSRRWAARTFRRPPRRASTMRRTRWRTPTTTRASRLSSRFRRARR